MKKICYIITKLELGGAQKTALYVAKHINKNNFETFLITGMGGVLDKEVFGKFRLYQLNNFIREINPIKDFRALLDIRDILKKEKPDIVHTHSSKAGILGRIAAKLAGVKTIVHTIHGYGFNDTQKWYVKCFYIYLEKFCSLFCHKLIAVSKEDIKKGVMLKIAKKDKFELIRAGIDINFYKNFVSSEDFRKTLKIAKTDKIVTTIGAFKPQKNLKDFIKVCNIVSELFKNSIFLVIGDGGLRGELENIIENLKLKNKIILLGWRTDIAEILKISDIFVLTSLWEGLPCAILEAMCCGKPVIANAVDGVKEIVSDNETGFLIEPYNCNMSAEKILYLLNNKTVCQRMGDKAKNSITGEFDINYAVKQHEELYNKL
jgi:glycosyltransferase involved in cell wall biosynthesis